MKLSSQQDGRVAAGEGLSSAGLEESSGTAAAGGRIHAEGTGLSCFTGGDSNGCLPNWTGNAWVQYNSKTTGFRFQHNSGPGSVIQYTQGGQILVVYESTGFAHWDYNNAFHWSCDIWGVCSAGDYYVASQRWDVFGVGDNYGFSARFDWTCVSECPAGRLGERSEAPVGPRERIPRAPGPTRSGRTSTSHRQHHHRVLGGLLRRSPRVSAAHPVTPPTGRRRDRAVLQRAHSRTSISSSARHPMTWVASHAHSTWATIERRNHPVNV